MSYFDCVQEFVEESARARDSFALAAAFERIAGRMGIRYFACASNVDWRHIPHDAVGITNYPSEWIAHYTCGDFCAVDPVFRTAAKQLTPFSWQDPAWRARLNEQELRIMYTAAEFGMVHGVTVPVHTNKSINSLCSLVFDDGADDPNVIHATHLMAVYLFEAAQSKHRTPVVLSRRPVLTQRQKECLQLVAEGKSDWVISKVLNISEATASFHVQSAMQRLGVASRTQAVARALYLGEILYLDSYVNVAAHREKAPLHKLVPYDQLHVFETTDT